MCRSDRDRDRDLNRLCRESRQNEFGDGEAALEGGCGVLWSDEVFVTVFLSDDEDVFREADEFFLTSIGNPRLEEVAHAVTGLEFGKDVWELLFGSQIVVPCFSIQLLHEVVVGVDLLRGVPTVLESSMRI